MAATAARAETGEPAGNGSPDLAVQSGKPAAQAALGYLDDVVFLPDGSLVLVDHVDGLSRVSRVSPDGILTEAWRKPTSYSRPLPVIGAASSLGGMEVGLLVDKDPDSELWRLPASGPPVLAKRFPGQRISWSNDAGLTADGARVLVSEDVFSGPAFALDLPALRINPDPISRTGAARRTLFDLNGAAFQVRQGSWEIEQLRPDGSVTVLGGVTPPGAGMNNYTSATVDPQGRLVFAHGAVVYRIEKGQAVRLAGGGAGVAGSDTKAIAFANPRALALDGAGGYYVADDTRVVRVDAQDQVTVVAEGLDLPPSDLALAADGRLLALLDGKLVALAPGAPPVALAAPVGDRFEDLAVAPDGSWLLADTRGSIEAEITLTRRVPGGTPTTLATYGKNHMAMAVAPRDGAVWYTMGVGPEYPHLYGQTRLMRLPPAGGAATVVAADQRFGAVYEGGLAIDAEGRAYFVSRPSVDERVTIQRYDPATKDFTVIAGPSGRAFAGSGADGTIEEPYGLVLNGAGDLVFVDRARRQLRRIPASALAP